MLSCKEVVVEIERRLDGELSWRARMALRMHLLMCRHCGRYERQLKLLLAGLQRLHSPATDAEVQQVLDAVNAADPGPSSRL